MVSAEGSDAGRPASSPRASRWLPAAGLRGRSGHACWRCRSTTGSARRPWTGGACSAGRTAASKHLGVGWVRLGPRPSASGLLPAGGMASGEQAPTPAEAELLELVLFQIAEWYFSQLPHRWSAAAMGC